VLPATRVRTCFDGCAYMHVEQPSPCRRKICTCVRMCAYVEPPSRGRLQVHVQFLIRNDMPSHTYVHADTYVHMWTDVCKHERIQTSDQFMRLRTYGCVSSTFTCMDQTSDQSLCTDMLRSHGMRRPEPGPETCVVPASPTRTDTF
jgi:hypothetical protein